MNRINEQPAYAPLGLKPWHQDNYGLAFGVVQSQLERFNAIGKSHCRGLGLTALSAKLVRQTLHNGGRKTTKVDALNVVDDDQAYRADMGLCTPSEAIELFHRNPHLGSMEIARLTHIGDWGTNDVIDVPVRNELLQAEQLGTELLHTPSYYKIGTIGHGERGIEGVGVARKREFASHFGGRVVSVIENNILVDMTDRQPETRELRLALREAILQDKSTRHATIGSIEDHMREPTSAKKPSALIPLSTIYYVTRPEERL